MATGAARQRPAHRRAFRRHGIFSHFPIIAFGIIGALSVLPKNWPAATKLLAAATLLLSLLVFIGYAALNPTPARAMYANRWFILFLPLLLFWAGAWLRQKHRGSTWMIAITFLVFSVTVTMISRDRSNATRWVSCVHPGGGGEAQADDDDGNDRNASPLGGPINARDIFICCGYAKGSRSDK